MSETDVRPVETAPRPAAQKRTLSWVGIVTLALALLSAFMGMVGYGAALAVESLFGLPRTALFTSPFELIELSNVSFLHLLSYWQEEGWSNFFAALWHTQLTVLLPALLVILLGLALMLWLKKRKGDGRFKLFGTKGHQPPKAAPSEKKKLLVLGGMTSAGVLIGIPAILYVSVALVVLSAQLLAFIPVLSMQASKTYLTRYVIAPQRCRSPETRAARMMAQKSSSELIVECVRVVKDGKEIGHGRVVLSTPSAIVLWQSQSGEARRVPLDGAIVELAPEPGDVNFTPGK
jgi:hypothetical protein